jgi:NitT/TauT family transport system substrate-binding protein
MSRFPSAAGRTLAIALAVGLGMSLAHAEGTEIRIGRTPTLSQLPIYVLEGEKLVEKHAKAAGLGDVTVQYRDVAGGAVLNDMLLANNLEFATGGVAPFLILWSKSADTPSEVKAVAAVGGTPSTLYTRNPKVKSIKDLGAGDKIAVAGVKSSQVAILLQMAAADAFGSQNYASLDHLTVTMRDADAVGAMKSGHGELTAHFTYDPYRGAYANDAAIRPILQSRDVLGGVGTVTVAYATKRFHDANPKTVAAYLAALKEADEIIQHDPARAARDFKALAKSTQSEA